MTIPREPSAPSGFLRNSTTKATDHELQKYDNFTRYRQALRGAHVRHPLAERKLHGGDHARLVGLVFVSLRLILLVVERRHQAEIDITLAQGLERLAVEVELRRGPERIDRVAEQQHLDAARAGSFELGIGFEPLRAFADQIIDLGLIFFQIGDVLLERTRLAGRCVEARERQQLVTLLEILVDTFLEYRAEGFPDLAEFFGVFFDK